MTPRVVCACIFHYVVGDLHHLL